MQNMPLIPVHECCINTVCSLAVSAVLHSDDNSDFEFDDTSWTDSLDFGHEGPVSCFVLKYISGTLLKISMVNHGRLQL